MSHDAHEPHPPHERRHNAAIALPAGKKWKAFFGLIGFSGVATLVVLILSVGAFRERFAAMGTQLGEIREQQKVFVRQYSAISVRVAEIESAENETRRALHLPPVEHQAVLQSMPLPPAQQPVTLISMPLMASRPQLRRP